MSGDVLVIELVSFPGIQYILEFKEIKSLIIKVYFSFFLFLIVKLTIQTIENTNPNDMQKIRPSSRSLSNIKSKINHTMIAVGRLSNPTITFLFFIF